MAGSHGSFMAAAGPDLLRAVQAAGQLRQFSRGRKILAAETSDPEGLILVIESGFVSTVANAESGQYTLLSIHGPGDLIGEHALFGNASHAYGIAVTAMTNGSARHVRKDRFRQILHGYPQGWEVLARHLHNRAAIAEERICLMANESARQRLAVFLLQLLAYDQSPRAPDDRAQEVPVPLSKAQMAEWIGVSRETVQRVLREWARNGIVQTRRSSLLVNDVRHLQKIAGAWRPFPLPSEAQDQLCPDQDTA